MYGIEYHTFILNFKAANENKDLKILACCNVSAYGKISQSMGMSL